MASKCKPANGGVTVNILFDTRDLCANCISEKYYELRDNHILDDDSIIRQRTCVGLALNTTKMHSDITVELPYSFGTVMAPGARMLVYLL